MRVLRESKFEIFFFSTFEKITLKHGYSTSKIFIILYDYEIFDVLEFL
jgi:hypothetical protein